MKKLYFCSNCLQYHTNSSASLQTGLRPEKFVRFSDLFCKTKVPAAHPQNMVRSPSRECETSLTTSKANPPLQTTPQKQEKRANGEVTPARAKVKPAGGKVTEIHYSPRVVSALRRKNPPRPGQNSRNTKTNANESTVIHSQIRARGRTPETAIPKKHKNISSAIEHRSEEAISDSKRKPTFYTEAKFIIPYKMEICLRKEVRRKNKCSEQLEEIYREIDIANYSAHVQESPGLSKGAEFEVMKPISMCVPDPALQLQKIIDRKMQKIEQQHRSDPACRFYDNRCLGSDFCAELEQRSEIEVTLGDLL